MEYLHGLCTSGRIMCVGACDIIIRFRLSQLKYCCGDILDVAGFNDALATRGLASARSRCSGLC